MSLLVSHPLGISNLRHVLATAVDAGLLQHFVTAIAVPTGLGAAWLPASLRQELSRRTFKEAPWSQTHTAPWRELGRQLSARAGLRHLQRQGRVFSVDEVLRGVDLAAARLTRRHSPILRAVYAYEDAAAETFAVARARGLATIYHLPIAYWRRFHEIMREEAELQPAWASTLTALADPPAKLARKDSELEAADHVVVPSRFVADSIAAHFDLDNRLRVCPYGFPPPSPAWSHERANGEPLKVLYAGQLGQRKGLAYLFAALRRLDVPYQLTLAGPPVTDRCEPLMSALADDRHRHLGPLPHAELLVEMGRNHVLVFPSLVDGFGMVITEAMSAGLPVIATSNTGAPEVIIDGQDGFIVPIRDADSIACRLSALYDNEDERQRLAHAARAKAAERGWTHFRERIAEILEVSCR